FVTLSYHPASRAAHLAPFLPVPLRMETAERALRRLMETGRHRPDFVALAVSRLGAFVPHELVATLLSDRPYEPRWTDWIRHLAREPWPEEPHRDVFRAHPGFEAFASVERPHEPSNDAAEALAVQAAEQIIFARRIDGTSAPFDIAYYTTFARPTS